MVAFIPKCKERLNNFEKLKHHKKYYNQINLYSNKIAIAKFQMSDF